MDLTVVCYVLLLAACVSGPYLAGVRPRDESEWRWLAITIGFLSWLLLGLAPLR